MHWTELLTGEDEQAAALLQEMLELIHPERVREDKWCWLLTDSLAYSVKSAYTMLSNQSYDSQLEEDKRKIIKKVWWTAIPSKFLVHGWRLLLDRLPTRLLLQQRGVMAYQHSPSCVFFFRHDEDTSHLFLKCRVTEELCKMYLRLARCGSCGLYRSMGALSKTRYQTRWEEK